MELIVLTKEEAKQLISECLTENKQVETNQPQRESRMLYSLKELADFLGCSIVRVQHLKNSGRIRFYQDGRTVIFKSDEVLEDLASHKKRK